MWLTRPTQTNCRSDAWWQALRATSPPIECPIRARPSTSTGQDPVSSSSSVASDAPFAEIRRPLL